MQITCLWLRFKEYLEMLWCSVSLLYQRLNQAFFEEIGCNGLCDDFIGSAFLVYLSHLEQDVRILDEVTMVVHHIII